jgi:predicted dehydrogenase
MGPRLRTDVDIIDDYMIHDLYLYNGLFKNGFADTISGNVMKNFGKDIKHDTAFVTIDYLDTVTTFFSSWNYPRKERLIEIVGDRGSIIWKDDKVTFIRSYYNNINGEDKYRNQGYELIEGYEIDITPEITKSNLDLEFDDFINYEYRQEIQVLTNQLILDIKEKLLYSNE